MKNFLVAVVVVGAIVGFKGYSFNESKNEIREHLFEICEGDRPCEVVVTDHFDTCFAESSTAPGRRHAGSLDGPGLAKCLNEKAGQELFVFDEE